MNEAIYNPHNKPPDELPVIYGFNSGGTEGWYVGVLMAQSGHYLGGHCCSHENFMWGDLGITEGSRPDRHEYFQKHYPDGYRMEFVPYAKIKAHTGLQAALRLNQQLPEPAKEP